MSSQTQWIDTAVDYLCHESIFGRATRTFSKRDGIARDPDHVSMLRHLPLGMFFYNLRAVVLLASGVALVGCLLLAWMLRVDDRSWAMLLALTTVWVIAVVVTLLLHRSFLATVDTWARDVGNEVLPRAFYRYFLLDSGLIIAVYAVGRLLRPGYDFNAFCWLLLANTIVYTGYDLIAARRRYGLVLVLPLLTGLALLWDVGNSALPRWVETAVRAAPIVATCLLSVLAVHAIARARRLQATRDDAFIATLADVSSPLAPPPFEEAIQPAPHRDYRHYREREFHQRLLDVLREVCSKDTVWFRSAVLWLYEYHQNRGDVLVPIAYHNAPFARERADGVTAPPAYRNTPHAPILVRSLRQHSDATTDVPTWLFDAEGDYPAAMIPIGTGDRSAGILVIYGTENSPPVLAADRTFLRALAALLVNGLQQWETFLRALALNDLDALFGCDTLDDLLMHANGLLKQYLAARGCMIVFRSSPASRTMEVRAVDGFKASILGATYEVGVGETGRCAESGRPIRVDDVRSVPDGFDGPRFRRIERAHGVPIQSWLAIPIGRPDKNYGVIKVVNSLYPYKWFTGFDQRLGIDIALRLLVMIEKLQHLERAEEAKERAQRSEAVAIAETRRAIAETERREQDIMTVMHQLQAPLLAISNALTAIELRHLSSLHADLVNYATALVDDALNLGFGTVAVFAHEAGKRTMFQESEIDASEELAGLTRRLQRTQSRDDLTFRFQQEPGFPRLIMDSAVFASVFYSLIHNAMKYAAVGSEVTLQCGFEFRPGGGRIPALKVKTVGEPIHPDEREAVFSKFVRGRGVERGKVYRGVGLGLWVARGLMEMLGGKLTLELAHDHPERSVFVVYIPGAERYA